MGLGGEVEVEVQVEVQVEVMPAPSCGGAGAALAEPPPSISESLLTLLFLSGRFSTSNASSRRFINNMGRVNSGGVSLSGRRGSHSG